MHGGLRKYGRTFKVPAGTLGTKLYMIFFKKIYNNVFKIYICNICVFCNNVILGVLIAFGLPLNLTETTSIDSDHLQCDVAPNTDSDRRLHRSDQKSPT